MNTSARKSPHIGRLITQPPTRSGFAQVTEYAGVQLYYFPKWLYKSTLPRQWRQFS